MGEYQLERLIIMTSKTLQAGLLTSLVFLILIEFSNSNPSGIRPVSFDGKGNGVVQSLPELKSKESEPSVREKRAASTPKTTGKTTGKTTTRKITTRKPKNSANPNAGSPALVCVLMCLSFFSLD